MADDTQDKAAAKVAAQDKAAQPQETTTKASTFQDAAAAVDLDAARAQGFIGESPERERTGRADKGLSQQNPAILNGDPVPDARPQVDDSAALAALKSDTDKG